MFFVLDEKKLLRQLMKLLLLKLWVFLFQRQEWIGGVDGQMTDGGERIRKDISRFSLAWEQEKQAHWLCICTTDKTHSGWPPEDTRRISLLTLLRLFPFTMGYPKSDGSLFFLRIKP